MQCRVGGDRALSLRVFLCVLIAVTATPSELHPKPCGLSLCLFPGPGWPRSCTRLWCGVIRTKVFAPFGLGSVARWQLPVQGSLHPYCCAHSSQVEPRFLHHIWEARLWFNLLALQDEDLPVETFSSLWIPCTGTDPDPIPLSPSYLATWRSFLKLWLHRNSVSFQLVFQENCSIQRCIFDMFMGVRELHVFLFHCLDPLPCFHIFLMVGKFFSKNDILRHEKIIWNSNFSSTSQVLLGRLIHFTYHLWLLLRSFDRDGIASKA